MKALHAIYMLITDRAFICPKYIVMPITGNLGRCNKVHFKGVDGDGQTVPDDVTFYVPAELQTWGKP